MHKLTTVAVVAILLSACSPKISETVNTEKRSTASTESFPVDSVLENQYTKSDDVTLSKTDKEFGTISLNFVTKTLPDGEFEGVKVKRMKGSSAMEHVDTGTKITPSETESYFTVKPFKYIGSTATGSYEVSTENVEAPEKAKIGEFAGLYKSTVWKDSTKRTKLAEISATWRLLAASDDTAWLCEQSEKISVDKKTDKEIYDDCVEIDTQGNVLDKKIVIFTKLNGKRVKIPFTSTKS